MTSPVDMKLSGGLLNSVEQRKSEQKTPTVSLLRSEDQGCLNSSRVTPASNGYAFTSLQGGGRITRIQRANVRLRRQPCTSMCNGSPKKTVEELFQNFKNGEEMPQTYSLMKSAC
jgi:hypothetical protein